MLLLTLLVPACQPVTEANAGFVASVEEGPPRVAAGLAGVWNLRWDRSGIGWSPTYFHGTLVVTEEGVVGLEWFEHVGPDPSLLSLANEVSQTRIELLSPGEPNMWVSIEVTTEGEVLSGRLRWVDGLGRGAPWSPLTGRRVPHLTETHPLPWTSE